MAELRTSVSETRRNQMFPTLTQQDIERLRRFGTVASYPAGAQVVKAGDVALGLYVILKGELVITPHEASMREQTIVTHGAGGFMGELAQLSGRPSLVDATAKSDVEAIVVPSRRLRDVMVEEAELGERIMRALILRRIGLLESGVGGPIIIGRADNRDVLRLQGFLRRNGHPSQYLDSDTDNCAKTLLDRFQLAQNDLPIVLCPNGEILRNPTENQLARCIGLTRTLDPNALYDVAIIGAGPAGLAAAVYATTEGLSTIVLDCRAFGGQAGASSRIENYMGFPTGISGIALMARAYNQAQKFGAEMAIPEEVVKVGYCSQHEEGRFILGLPEGERVTARAVVIASGAEYRKLGVENLPEFEGSCVHYWASPLEGRLCAGQEVALVGAGNSAGQAAVYLATQVKTVFMLVRGKSLDATMSRYLCERIAAQPNIKVLLETEVTGLEGHGGVLDAIRWRDRKTGEESRCEIGHLFLLIGAEPNTSWLSQYDVAVDSKGFILADTFAANGRLPFETSRPGIFAIGDVRAGSVKRVAAAVGEGAQVVATLHAFFARTGEKPDAATAPVLGEVRV